MKTIKNPFTRYAAKLLAVPAFMILLSPMCSYAQDNTAALQTQLNAGNVTLTAGATYNVTGLTVTHSLNLNGATINMTAATGAAIKLTAAGAIVTNGTIKGTWDYTTANNVSGTIGMRILANNCTITNVHLTQFPSYGILVGAYNNPIVTGCTIDKIGYIGFYFDAESAVTTGGTFSNNVVDRSMIAPATVSQLAVGIRGSTNNAAVTTSGWTVTGNTFKMPYLPKDWAAECIEVRYFNNSTIASNTCIGGSIGISVVRSSGVTVTGNKYSNSQLEGLEFADSMNCTSTSDIISSSASVGVLVDGGTGCNGISITGAQISGTALECIHAYTNTSNLKISGCTLTTSTKAVNLQGTNAVSISNTTFKGNGVAALAVMLDCCPGNLTMTGGAVGSFTKAVIAISNTKTGLVTDNVQMSGVTLSSTPGGLSSYVANGGAIGTHITVQ